jgi:hypothetical protein
VCCPSRRKGDFQLGDGNVNATKPTLKQRAYQGIKEYLVISCYLWVVFGLFALYKSVILAEQHIGLASQGFALLNALALAKVMLVAQELHLADQFKVAPLIYPTLFKSATFAILLGCFKIIEETAVGLYHRRSFTESISALGGGTLKGILSLMALLAFLLIPFFGFTELGRIFGEGKLQKLFFTSRHLSDT